VITFRLYRERRDAGGQVVGVELTLELADAAGSHPLTLRREASRALKLLETALSAVDTVDNAPGADPAPDSAPDPAPAPPASLPSGVPASGRALLDWAKARDRARPGGDAAPLALGYLLSFGRSQGWPGRISEWSPTQAAHAYHEWLAKGQSAKRGAPRWSNDRGTPPHARP
jgi:hypothetical protein